jgi:NTP pyrophosphatase (non-canonical NTP hydrolase)
MNMNEYQSFASRTAKAGNVGFKNIISDYCMGLAGESGEVVDYLKKVVHHGHELDQDKLEKELGDVLWYLSQVAKLYNIPLARIAQLNIAKLQKRFPNGFNTEDSLRRVDTFDKG